MSYGYTLQLHFELNLFWNSNLMVMRWDLSFDFSIFLVFCMFKQLYCNHWDKCRVIRSLQIAKEKNSLRKSGVCLFYRFSSNINLWKISNFNKNCMWNIFARLPTKRFSILNSHILTEPRTLYNVNMCHHPSMDFIIFHFKFQFHSRASNTQG